MKEIYKSILNSINKGEKLLAVLIDPDKMRSEELLIFLQKLNNSIVSHIFVGGSTVKNGVMDGFITCIRENTRLPIVIFPGDVSQISNQADAILFLSLISGRNPDYLIEKQVQSVSKLKDSDLEIISTGYVLIENGKETAVQRVSETEPLKVDNVKLIVDTAKAGEYLGMKLIYLEAGSGAIQPVPSIIIRSVRDELKVPLLVGGGIRNIKQLQNAYKSGADLVVIGTAFEENKSFFDELNE